MPLLGERILLRDFESEDWRFVNEFARLPEVWRYQAREPNTAEESRAFVDGCRRHALQEPRTAYELAIQWRQSGRLMGTCSLVVDEPRWRRAHIGYVVHPDYQRQGVATEAALLLLRFGFEALGLHRIEATCDPRNLASTRVLEKVGMTLEGRRRQDLLIRDGWRNSLLFAILEDEWRSASLT